MGLLEEAIREHLELQRRRGADPNGVARAEQEALQPLVPGQTPAWAEKPMLFDLEHSTEATQAPPLGAAPGEAAPIGAAPAEAIRLQALVEQETAELDMSTVLGEFAASRGPAQPSGAGLPEFAPEGLEFGPVRARRIVHGAEAARSGEESDFEWEMPERSSASVDHSPSARRGSFVFE